MTSCSIRLLGGSSIQRDGSDIGGPAAQRHRLALLALLARAHPRAVPRERAMAMLWPERDERHARSLLNLAVHVLRAALGPDAIRARGAALALDAERVSCDVVEFSAAVAAGEHERAVSLYGGAFVDGLFLPAAPEFERWVDGERAALAADCARSLAALADRARGAGDAQAAADLYARQLALDPYASRAALALAESLDALGERGAAVRALERHAELLRTDLASEPGAAVLDLLERLRGRARAGRSPARQAREIDGDAVLFTLKARHFVAKRDAASLRKAIEYFERARAADPAYAPAHAGLADAWSLLGFYDVLAPREAFSHARAAAHRAIALDPRSADGYASMGYILLYHHWSWDRAERAFRRAIALDGTHAQAHQWLGNCLALLGRADESREMMRRSRSLAPASPIANAAFGWAEYFSGRFDRAVELQLESIELEPAFPVAHLWLGQALARTRRWPEAIAALRRACDLFERSDAATAALARAHAEAGDPGPAREIAGRLGEAARAGEYAPSYELAKIHAALGERDRALAWLERARAERSHSIAFLRVDPEVASLRDDSRLAALAGSVGLV